MIDRTINKKYVLVVGLLYPAVLGSIFYSLFPILQAKAATMTILVNEWPFCVLVLTTLVFYSIDYLYTASQPNLGWSSFVSSFIVVCSMYVAFDGVNVLSHPPRLSQHCYSMAFTFTIFLIIDYLHRGNYGRFWRRLLCFEAFIVIAFLVFAAQNTSPKLVACVSLILCGWMIVMGNAAYSTDLISIQFSKCFSFPRLEKISRLLGLTGMTKPTLERRIKKKQS